MSTMHVIVIADIDCNKIGKTVQIDIQRIQSQLIEYSSICDMWLSIRILKGHKFNRDLIIDTIKKLYVRPDDVVFFYYAGHGYRNMSKEDPWPLMYIDDGLFAKGFDTRWIYKMLRYKHPRLLIMLTDSCQEFVEDHKIENVSPYQNQSRSPTKRTEGCVDLFKHARGEALLISCDKGESSYGNAICGGFYSHNVFESIERTFYASEPTWENVAKLSQFLNNPHQNPIWRVTDDSLSDLIFSGDPDDIDNWVRSKSTSRSLPPQIQSESQQPSSFGGTSLSSQDRVQSIRERSQQRLQSVRSTQPKPSAFCSNCGTELRSGARFCGKCGHKN